MYNNSDDNNNLEELKQDNEEIDEKTYQDFNKRAPKGDEVKKEQAPEIKNEPADEAETKEGAGAKILKEKSAD